MKRFCSVLLAMCLAIVLVKFDVKALYLNGYYYSVNNNQVTITDYSGSETNLILPKEIDGYPVTVIGAYAFEMSNVVSVVIPEGVHTIGSRAFNRTNLKSITIPSTLKYWEQGAFAFSEVEKVYISDIAAWCNITYKGNVSERGPLESGRAKLYLNGELITKLVIPAGVNKIYASRFEGCDSIVSVVIPSTITAISTDAFANCSSIKDVWYEGSEEDKTEISINSSNSYLLNATWHYNSCPVGAPHEYSNDCDDECNGCGLKRDVPEHTYDNACDTDCNVCKAIRQTQHTYDNSCDTECNICKSTRNTTHSYGQWNTVRKADCTTSGAQNRECSVCHNIDTKSVDPLNHDYETKWTVDKEETCTEAGSKSHHCIRCDATKDITTIKPSGHTWGKWVTVKEATTAEEGRSERTCTSCQKKESQSIAKLAEDGHVHRFGEWDIKKVATCAEQGKAERKCSICEETESKDILATGHQVGDWEETAPTCIKDGYRIRKCLVCGNLEKIVLNALGHKYDGENICVRCEAVQEKTEDSEIMGDIDNNEDASTIHTNKIKGYSWMIWVTLALVVIIGLGVFLIKRKNKTTF